MKDAGMIVDSVSKERKKPLKVIENASMRVDAGFCSSLDHVLSELKRVELKLQLQVRRMREGNISNNAGFRDLCITDKEIDDILNNFNQQSEILRPRPEPAACSELAEMVEHTGKSIAARKQDSLARGLHLRLDVLKDIFGLSQFDIDTLLLCLLPEIDLNYGLIFAYLQDDATKKSPTIDLILQLLCDSIGSRIKAREYFSVENPLVAHELIHLQDNQLAFPVSLLSRYIWIDERIASYLLDSDEIDEHLSGFAFLTKPEIALSDMVLPDKIKSRLSRLIENSKNQGILYYLSGTDEARKHLMAEAICAGAAIPMLRIEAANLTAVDKPDERLISRIFREGRLQNAAIYISGFNNLLNNNKENRLLYERVISEIKSYPQWTILSGDKDWQPREIAGNRPCYNIEISAASYSERKQTWDRFLGSNTGLAPDIDLAELAGKFKFTSGQIADAIALARDLARWRDPDIGIVTNEDLYAACRKQSREVLSSLARKIQSGYCWNDIVLPSDQMEQLREIANYVAHYHMVYSDWGFGRKVSSGKGLNVLFAGPSGTGKTMAAEVISNELGIDLYKIDLSSIVSKYIGETEKNLDSIFREGQTSNAILFFDEADALFGKRSEVRDSHDRYANIEVAYLLQKMDEYDGTVILATNLRKNMDDAFARRMHYVLEFPVPEEPDRYRIWKHIFPEQAPLSKDLDLKFMAHQFKISGGNIKNIALNAAFLATMNGGVIKTEHLIRATKREYQKIGKLCTESEFIQYFDLVKS